VRGCKNENSSGYANAASFDYRMCSIQRILPLPVVWDHIVYNLSDEEVPSQLIGDEIGEIQTVRHPLPKQNGEANGTPVGSKLYKIKNIEQQEAIAVKVRDTYKKAEPM
jgi:hypothetical protein